MSNTTTIAFDFKHETDRALDEANDLCEKLVELRRFVQGSSFHALDRQYQDLLIDQEIHMSGYLAVMKKRIELMNEVDG